MEMITERAKSLIELKAGALEQFEAKLSEWISLGIWKRIPKNLKAFSEYALVAGQIEARVFGDYPKSLSYFSAGASIGMKALELRELGPSFDPSEMTEAICCAVLAGRWVDAESMARATLGCPRLDSQMAFYEGAARLLSATVLDDLAAHSFERSWVDARRPKSTAYWWDVVLSVYHDLESALLARDADQFATLMAKRAKNFACRPHDRRMADVGIKEGGTVEHNALVIDYLGTAVAKIARRRGLDWPHESPSVPSALM